LSPTLSIRNSALVPLAPFSNFKFEIPNHSQSPMNSLAKPTSNCFTPTMDAGEPISPARCRTLGAPRRSYGLAPASGSNQGFSQCCQHQRNAHWPAILRPPLPVHPNHEPARRKWWSKQQHLQTFISTVILDRNSQVCFHNHTQTQQLTKVNRARPRARSLSQTYCWTEENERRVGSISSRFPSDRA
jgi:hypothetical protein